MLISITPTFWANPVIDHAAPLVDTTDTESHPSGALCVDIGIELRLAEDTVPQNDSRIPRHSHR